MLSISTLVKGDSGHRLIFINDDRVPFKLLPLSRPVIDHKVGKESSGQSLTELAILLPLLLLMLVGTLDLGRAFFAYVTVANAAREGARAGSDNWSDLGFGIEAAVQREAASNGVPITSLTIAKSCENGSCSACPAGCQNGAGICPTVGSGFTVSVTYDFPLVTRYIFNVGSIPVQASATRPIITSACK